jgi:hypothetical protein
MLLTRRGFLVSRRRACRMDRWTGVCVSGKKKTARSHVHVRMAIVGLQGCFFFSYSYG